LSIVRQGAFFEPQATIAVAWTDLDNFILVGNSVKFGDETDVRDAWACASARATWPRTAR
jgi:hypothetical protein